MQTVEKKHNIEGIVVTVILHALVLVLFYFFILRTPNPPLVPTMGGGGVEVSLGDPNAGTNNMDNMLPVETVTPEELNQNEEVEQQEEETPQEINEAITTPTESEDAVAINAKESKDKKTEEKKTDNKSTETTPKSTEKPRTMAKSGGSTSSQSSTSSGADKNTKGDPGNTNGKTQNGRYFGDNGTGGGKGGGNGTGTGKLFGPGFGNWEFEGDPYPVDNSNEFGTIQFTLVVNEDGKVINVLEGKNFGVSPRVVNIYKNHLLKLSVEAPAGYDIVPGMKIPVEYTLNPKK